MSLLLVYSYVMYGALESVAVLRRLRNRRYIIIFKPSV